MKFTIKIQQERSYEYEIEAADSYYATVWAKNQMDMLHLADFKVSFAVEATK